MEEELNHNPDNKAKALHLLIEKKQKAANLLDKSNKLSLLRNKKFIATDIPDPKYLFSVKILPTMKQVIHYYLLIFIIIISSLLLFLLSYYFFSLYYFLNWLID